MFTGLIKDVGVVLQIERKSSGAKLWVATKLDVSSFESGESIAVDGVCLTVAEVGAGRFRADVSSESFARTTLAETMSGKKVNLERAMKADDRFGGHFVLGHIDGVGKIAEVGKEGEYAKIVVTLPQDLAKYIVEKGSVAINGVSLTVNKVSADSFALMIIPTTLAETNLNLSRPGDKVNIETDVIGKYVEKFVNARTGGVTMEKLKSMGWD